MLRADSKSWNAGAVDHACVRAMPEQLFKCAQELRLLLFQENMLPKPWAVPFMQHSKTSSRASANDPTGRVDIRFRHGGLDDFGDVAIDLLKRASHQILQCLQDLGMRSETIAELVNTDSYVHVAFCRCQRTQFITTSDSRSGPFEEVLVLLPLTRGKPVAIWDQAVACQRDGTPECVIPNDYVILTDTPYALLSTTVTEVNHVCHAFIVLRFSIQSGYIATMKPKLPPFDARPEELLLLSTSQPPIRNCVVCRGVIRERRHGDLSGDRSKSDHDCSLAHCTSCRKDFPNGPYYLCEFCVLTKLGPYSINEIDISANESFGNVLRLSCSHYFSSNYATVCRHQHALQNDLVSTLFLLLDARELQAAARFFRDFFAFASWHQTFAPASIIQTFEESHHQVWNAFYKEFCANSHCPRVQVACYAMQCALNTGPVLRARTSHLHRKSREIYFDGKLSSAYNVGGFEECVMPRTLHAAAMAEGLFDHKTLKVVAIRVFKVLSEAKFNTSFACCCSGFEERGEDAGALVLRCRGPSLDLSSDVGQEHQWVMSPLRNDSRAAENRATLRVWQRKIRQVLSQATFVFDHQKHATLPQS